MARVDWSIVPSTWWEIFGLVISEAWMFGKPVICSNRGGPGDPQRGIVLVRGGMPSADDTVLDFTDFISYRKDLLESLLVEPAARFRLFLGYAGWGEGQLDQELEGGGWARLPLNPSWLMSNDPTELWTQAIQSISSGRPGGAEA